MEKIIYHFETKPSFGYSGMPGGRSVTVYEDGRIEEGRYVFGKDELDIRDVIAVDLEAVNKIREIMDAHKDEIDKFPSSYSNDVMDGTMDKIQLGNKVICTMCISRTDLEKIKDRNSLYYEEACISNQILDIKDEIDEIIHAYESSELIKLIDFISGDMDFMAGNEEKRRIDGKL